MTEFTPIALAAVLAMALLGRVAGVSGIVGGLFALTPSDRRWRACFLLGLIAAPFAVWLVSGEKPQLSIPVPPALVVLGGLLVGVGTSIAGGCTSGHGVCGIARLSPRSVAATLTFMATAIATVYCVRHVLGLW